MDPAAAGAESTSCPRGRMNAHVCTDGSSETGNRLHVVSDDAPLGPDSGRFGVCGGFVADASWSYWGHQGRTAAVGPQSRRAVPRRAESRRSCQMSPPSASVSFPSCRAVTTSCSARCQSPAWGNVVVVTLPVPAVYLVAHCASIATRGCRVPRRLNLTGLGLLRARDGLLTRKSASTKMRCSGGETCSQISSEITHGLAQGKPRTAAG